ncbi:hypothetical protein [Methanolinea mesophila]|nr:hypothetical protein [Methanolinea mesophila]
MRDEVERAVRVLSVPGGVVEVRAVAENGTHSGYFDDPVLLARSSELLDLATVHGVYVTLNEVAPALIARRANRVKMRLGAKDATTSDGDILRRRWFPVDIDPVRPSGVSATDEERDLAFRKADELAAWLAEQGVPEPVCGDSGNGAHLLYRIDLPNDEESKQLVQRCLAVLALFFSDERCTVDTAVFNAARIWKLYGTVSRKGDHTRERPHRRSHLLSVPDPVPLVSRETLERLAGLLPTTDPGPENGMQGPAGNPLPDRRASPGLDRSASPNHWNSRGLAEPSGQSRGKSPGLTGPSGLSPGTFPARKGTVPPNAFSRAFPTATASVQGRDRTKVYEDGNVPIELRGWLREHGIAVRYEKPWQGGTLFVLEECPFSSAHRDGAFAIRFPSGAVYAGCKHASCGGGTQRWQELRRMYDTEYAEREREGESAAVPGTGPGVTGDPMTTSASRLSGTSQGVAGNAVINSAPGLTGTSLGKNGNPMTNSGTPRAGTPPGRTGNAVTNSATGLAGTPLGKAGNPITNSASPLSGANSGTESDPENGSVRMDRSATSPSRQEPGLPPNLNDPPGAASDNPLRDRAREILSSGDPRKFILDTFAKCHVGDEVVAACYLASILSTTVANSRGLHVCPTGDSGKGKSDSANAFLRLLPAEAKMQGSITSKALFYHGVPPGSAIIFDDFSMSEDLREVLKNATSKFQHGLSHYTLNANRQPVVLELPPRCVWWVLSVDNPGDDQVLNRMMNPWIDDSEQQDMRVRDHIFARACRSGGAPEEDEDVAVCREIFSLVREQLYTVRIPFAKRIRMDSIRNRRNPIMFLDIVRSFAALRFMQRGSRTLPDGTTEIDAAEEDFRDAAGLFTALDSTDGGQTSKLLKNEKLLLDSVLAMKTGEFTLKDAQAWMGLPYVAVRRILHGRLERDRDTGGLLAKCPALGVIEMTVSEGTIAAVTRKRENHYTFDYERYRSWTRGNGVWLSEGDPDHKNRDGPDPNDPIKKRDGITNGIRSDFLENGQIENPDDIKENTKNNCTLRSHNSKSAASPPDPGNSHQGGEGSEVCSRDPGSWDHENENIPENERNGKEDEERENLVIPDLIPSGPPMGSWDHLREQDYIALPYDSDEPCHLCGSAPTSSVKIRQLTDPPDGEEKYLCFVCLKRVRERERTAKRDNFNTKSGPAQVKGIAPLPGLLNPGDFTRAKCSQGKCAICGGNDAVFRSASKAMSCCEKCYGRLVREGNRAEGAG